MDLLKSGHRTTITDVMEKIRAVSLLATSLVSTVWKPGTVPLPNNNRKRPDKNIHYVLQSLPSLTATKKDLMIFCWPMEEKGMANPSDILNLKNFNTSLTRIQET